MPKTWEEWSSFFAIVALAMSFIAWIVNVWIVKPLDKLTKSLDRLSIKIDGISNRHDKRLDNHDRRLDRHHSQIKSLKLDVDQLKGRSGHHEKD